MANPSHVDLVARGPDALQSWRLENPWERLDLRGADFGGCRMAGVNLAFADLREANVSGAHLSHAILVGANLSNADLSGALLAGADVSADYGPESERRSRFFEADLRNASLRGAWLVRTRFRRALLEGADFTAARLGQTLLADIDLSETIGLEQADHWGPSHITISTIYQSRGEIPVAFLRGCGVPENLITYLPSLTGQAVEFYTSFLSYTSSDEAFASRLYTDLQACGIRCWRWLEDAKWGRSLTGEIDRAIRAYDKLIVVLSTKSLGAEPVIREIERAIQKEQREGKEVLFPIRLDDAVFDWSHELQADVVRKNIGDFREWRDAQAYKGAIDRLLKGLKSAQP